MIRSVGNPPAPAFEGRWVADIFRLQDRDQARVRCSLL
nr:hypothetical protein JVH1_6976 [Rhodococcus sp. JVH1]